MYFGFHASAAGGVDKAPARAASEGAEVFQFFSRSPRGGSAPALTLALINNWQAELKKNKIRGTYIHSPYYINFASDNNRIRYGSISVIRDELERGSTLGVKGLMTHLGSAKNVGEKKGTQMVIEGLVKVLTGYKGTTKFLLENSAGSGAIIGDTIDELAVIIKQVEKKLKKKNTLGVCWDTQHGFASGYDLRTKKATDFWLKEFNKKIGLKRLMLIHANDSKPELGSHVDRHADIGQGKIGLEAFKILIHQPKLRIVDLILETPAETKTYAQTIKQFKQFRDDSK
ncbi:MAG: deoxyribonuclease IV [Candidatus Komeilibacteria bacterium]